MLLTCYTVSVTSRNC